VVISFRENLRKLVQLILEVLCRVNHKAFVTVYKPTNYKSKALRSPFVKVN